jgi:hypothetical protein
LGEAGERAGLADVEVAIDAVEDDALARLEPEAVSETTAAGLRSGGDRRAPGG